MAGGGVMRILRVVPGHPGVLLELLRTAWTFRRRGWYRRPPFLPLPPRRYVAWRMHTAYADPEATPDPGELRRYLRWAARMRREMKR